MKLFNWIMSVLLRSPLHFLFSNGTLVITFTGRTSGRIYSTPVNYVQDGQTILITSLRSRTWWRNLRGGSSVSIRLRGMDIDASANVIEDEKQVVSDLMIYLKKRPRLARYFNVRLDPSGQPRMDDVEQAAMNRIMVRLNPNRDD